MIKALNTAATGMSAQETHVNTIANNIANANTIGFKKGRTEFEDLMYETITSAGSRSSANTKYNVGTQIGTGSKVSAVRKEFTAGNPQITNNPFDLMINGEGFFEILLPNGGKAYTRNGMFNVDAGGNIVNSSGFKLSPGITLPPNTLNVTISESGNIDTFIKGQVEPVNNGQIPVFVFTNPVGLHSMGKNLYKNTAASGVPMEHIPGSENAGYIMQGTLESSNVTVMNEMTNLIKAQRSYEMNSKVMGVADQMLQTVNNIR